LWLTDLQTLCVLNAVILLNERVITLKEATRHELDYCETSNFTEIFVRFAATVHGKAKTGRWKLSFRSIVQDDWA
jgi:hypothetical protein